MSVAGNAMQTEAKLKYMTNEESYTQRRMLFKDIWETAMNIDEKEDIMNKPKIIKTLRLDEVDKCVVGKTKKQRIKNLRHVCNRILDFCDRQDADDVFYAQLTADTQEPVNVIHRVVKKHPKKKIYLGIKNKRLNNAKSTFSAQKDVPNMNIISERKSKINPQKTSSPVANIRQSVVKTKPKTEKPMAHVKEKEESALPVPLSLAPLDEASGSNNSKGSSDARRKPVRMKHSKRKKPSDFAVQTLNMMKTKINQRSPSRENDISKPLPQFTKIMTN